MSRRRKHRGQRRPGLFAWDGDTTVADDQADNPLTRLCTHCLAGVGNLCTRPGPHGSRIAMHGEYHESRKNQQEQA